MRTNFIKEIKEKVMRTKFIKEKFMKKMIGVFAVFAMLGLILTCENTLYKNEAKKAVPKTEEEETGGGYYYPTYPQSPAKENDDPPPPAERVIKGTSDAGEVVLTLTEIPAEAAQNISGAMFSVMNPVNNETFNYTLTLADIQVSHGTVKIEKGDKITKWNFTSALNEEFNAILSGGYLEFTGNIIDETTAQEVTEDTPSDPDAEIRVITIPRLGGSVYVGGGEEDEGAEIIAATALSLDKEEATMERDYTLQLTATVEPAGAEVWWGSSNPAIVSVTQDGLVTALKANGEAEIKVIAGGKSAVCKVTVPPTAGLFIGSDEVDLSGRTEATLLAKALGYITATSASNRHYTIALDTSEEKDGATYTIQGTAARTNIKVTLKGKGEGVTITKTAAGALFTVYGQTTTNNVPELILENITLKGYASNNNALVVIGSGTNAGKLTMKDGSRITENKSTGNNTGGGVRVLSPSVFTMEGGSIDNNEATTTNNTTTSRNGGGVNSAGDFTMTGGVISNNKASLGGGGVYATSFTMSGGTISDNTASTAISGTVITEGIVNQGGGVNATKFTMSGGSIENNTAVQGGGVYISNGTVAGNHFTMTGGTIAGNRASTNGAAFFTSGLLPDTRSIEFNKTGGIIYGTTNEDAAKANRKTDESENDVHAIELLNQTTKLRYYDADADADTVLYAKNTTSGATLTGNWQSY